MTKRKAGSGTVQMQGGRWRLRLPRSLDPSRRWLDVSFPADHETLANAAMDAAIVEARKLRSVDDEKEGLTFAKAWPQYVSNTSRASARRHSVRSATKVRTRLEGMGENWLSASPFWRTPIPLIGGFEIEQWLSKVQLEGRNAKGGAISDSWIDQMASTIRNVFKMLRYPVPVFTTDTHYKKVDSALNVETTIRFLAQMSEPLDRIMAGCQMGAGLRVGEMLSLTIDRVHLGDDPHLMITTGGPDGAPTKSKKPRRVELFDPGLGFFRLAVAHHHRPNDKNLLFCGPSGGYLGQWGEKFVEWSAKMGQHITTHDLRHSYAGSVLSGLWGHAPQDITFVSRQLGHVDIRTTQQSYGHFDPSAGLNAARRMRGEIDRNLTPITAEELLGLPRASIFSPLEAPSALSSEDLLTSVSACGPENHSPAPSFESLGVCSPLSQPTLVKNQLFSAKRVSDGNCPKPPNFSGDLEISDYNLAHFSHFEALKRGRALVEAVLVGSPGLREAAAFLRTLPPDDPAVLRALLMVIDEDPRAVRQALGLAGKLAHAAQDDDAPGANSSAL